MHCFALTLAETIINWHQFQLLYSTGNILGTARPGEFVGVTFDWIYDKRYSNTAWVEYPLGCSPDAGTCFSVPSVPANSVPNGSTALCGTGTFPSGAKSNTWRAVLNTNLPGNADVAATYGDGHLPLRIDQTNCPPFGCGVPPSGALSAPVTWSSWAPADYAGDGSVDITIGPTDYVFLDISPARIGTLIIYGKLEFLDKSDLLLQATNILVWGALQIGTADAPFAHKAEILLMGQRDTPEPDPIDNNLFLGNKVLVVLGNASLYGQPRVPCWVKLAKTAEVGDKSVTLATSVGGSAGHAWAPGDQIIFAPTEFDTTQVDYATITSVNGDGKTLALAAPLLYRHFAGPLFSTVSSDARSVPVGSALAAKSLHGAVGLLSRNIVIRGDLEPYTGTDTELFYDYKIYGGHVTVSAINRAPSVTTPHPLVYAGKLEAHYVQFDQMGQGGTPYHAIDFQFGGFLFTQSDQATGTLANNPVSTLSGCAFTSILNDGVYASSARNLVFDNNVFTPSWHKASLFLGPDAFGAVITRNLVIGNQVSPHFPMPYYQVSAGIFLDATPASLRDNVVSGCIDMAFVLRGTDCNDKSPYYSNNEAYASGFGFFMQATPSDSYCATFGDFTAWKNSGYGFYMVDLTSNLVVHDALLADNFVGTGMSTYVGGVLKVNATWRDLTYIGTSLASTCADSNSHGPAMATHRRNGFMFPTMALGGRGTFPGFDFFQAGGWFHGCTKPWEKRYGGEGNPMFRSYITGSTFAGFYQSDCGSRGNMITLPGDNPYYMPPPVFASNNTRVNVDFYAQFWMAATPGGIAIFEDVDGSLLGAGAGTTVVATGQELEPPSPPPPAPAGEPGCNPVAAWLGASLCVKTKFRKLSIDNNPSCRLFVERMSSNVTTWHIADGDIIYGDFLGNCAMVCNPSMTTFTTIPNILTKLMWEEAEPSPMRMTYLSDDPNEKTLIELFCAFATPSHTELSMPGSCARASTLAATLTLRVASLASRSDQAKQHRRLRGRRGRRDEGPNCHAPRPAREPGEAAHARGPHRQLALRGAQSPHHARARRRQPLL